MREPLYEFTKTELESSQLTWFVLGFISGVMLTSFLFYMMIKDYL